MLTVCRAVSIIRGMLHEVPEVTQERRGTGYRRWFSDDEIELILWYEASEEITGFQLCYDVRGRERAFTWKKDTGLMHTAIDAGEESPLHNRSPILVFDPVVSVNKVLAEFNARAETLDPAIVAFISTTISSYSPGMIRDAFPEIK